MYSENYNLAISLFITSDTNIHFEKKKQNTFYPWIELRWRSGSGLDYGTGDLGWIHGVPSPRVDLPMTVN